MCWHPYDDGSTVGTSGSEGGRILRDEEHDCGIRITLEQGGVPGAPYAITCGVYGLMVHTAYFGELTAADHAWSSMQAELLHICQLAEQPDASFENNSPVIAACQSLVDRY